MPAQLSDYGLIDYDDHGIPVEALLRDAELGDPRAAYLLGLRFLDGSSGAPDAPEASRWFQLAAQRGLPEAQLHLAEMYALGVDLPQDKAKARFWYRSALQQGMETARDGLRRLNRSSSPGVSAKKAPVAAATATPGHSPRPGPMESWVSGLSASALTAQVGSFKDEAKARRFMARYLSHVPAGIHPSQRNGEQWYAVFFGEFQSRAEAKAAITTLPQRVRKMKPWIRSVAKVQAKMASTQP